MAAHDPRSTHSYAREPESDAHSLIIERRGTKRTLVLPDQVVDDETDTHTCAKCQLVFTKLEDYITHKLSRDNCKVSYSKAKGTKSLVPSLVVKGDKTKDDKRPKYTGKKRGPKGPRKGIILKENILETSVEYKCSKCPKGFRRQAALVRHMEYDHKEKKGSDDEVSDEAGEDDDTSPTFSLAQVKLEPKEITADAIDEIITEESGEEQSQAEAAVVYVNQSEQPQTDDRVQVVMKSFKSRPNPLLSNPDHFKMSSQRPYSCEICLKAFKDINVLKTHMLTHSDEREYKCRWKDCTYAFKTKGSLKRHMRRHTGERPYKCELCGRCFGESGALTRHLKSRSSCTNKGDNELPRYGKQQHFRQDIPAAWSKKESSNPTIHIEGSAPVPRQQAQTMIITKPSAVGQLLNADELKMIAEATGEQNIDERIAKAEQKLIMDENGEQQVLIVLNPVGTENVNSAANMQTNTPAIHQCEVCEEEFGDKEKLLTHLKSHLTLLPYKCDYCPYSVETAQELTVHLHITHKIKTLPPSLHQDSSDAQVAVMQHGNDVEGEVVDEHNVHQLQQQQIVLQDNMDELYEVAEEEGVQFIHLEGGEVEQINLPDGMSLQEVDVASEADIQGFVENGSIVQEVQIALPEQISTSQSTPITPVTQVEEEREVWIMPSTDSNELNSAVEEPVENKEIRFKIEPTDSEEMESEENQVVEKDGSIDSTQEVIVETVIMDDEHMVVEEEVETCNIDPMSVKVEEQQEGISASDHLEASENGTVRVINSLSDITNEDVKEELENRGNEDDSMDSSHNKTGDETDEQVKDASKALNQLLSLRSGQSTAQKIGKKTVHACPVCTRTFRASAYLKLHMRSHTGEKPHTCPVCRKTFMTRDSLMKHMVVHSTDRNYKCGDCGKLFKRISHVREHLKVHSADRPYPCLVCEKAFKTANACKVHMRTHTDVLPFECKFCHRNFREKGSLQRHERTHTGEKPFQCKYCGRAFAEHGTLNRHLKAKVPCHPQVPQQQHFTSRDMEQVKVGKEEGMEQGVLLPAGEDAAGLASVQVVQGPHGVTLVHEGWDEHQQLQERQQADGSQSADVDSTQMHETGATLLAEFSAVVADTQQYIVSNDLPETGDEMVMVATADDTVDSFEHGARLVTSEASENEQKPFAQLDTTQLQEGEYVIINQTEDTITLLNKHTGDTINMPASHVDTGQRVAGSVQVGEEVITLNTTAMHYEEGEIVEEEAMFPQ